MLRYSSFVLTPLLLLTPLAAGTGLAQQRYALWGDPANGRQVYADAGCGGCPAINGVGGTEGPDLGRPPAEHKTVTQMAGAMWNHTPEMRRAAEVRGIAFRTLTESEMLDLLTYLYSLHFLDREGDPKAGARLFVRKGCAACHTTSGDQAGIGPPLARFRHFASPILWAEVMWTHAVQMQEKMEGMGLEWPTFEGDEMVDLITFVRSETRSRKPQEH
jgi:mono/diheme cytochrome c family protein